MRQNLLDVAVQLVSVVDQHRSGENGKALEDAGMCFFLVDANPNQERGDDEDVNGIDPEPGGAGLEFFVAEVKMVEKDHGTGGDKGGKDGGRRAWSVVGEGKEKRGDDDNVKEVDQEEVGGSFHGGDVYYCRLKKGKNLFFRLVFDHGFVDFIDSIISEQVRRYIL